VLGPIFADQKFAALFPTRGQPAEAPWRLALVTLMQFAENLSDRRAADAARSRIDWKYLLGLELADPSFDASALSEFRSRLVATPIGFASTPTRPGQTARANRPTTTASRRRQVPTVQYQATRTQPFRFGP